MGYMIFVVKNFSPGLLKLNVEQRMIMWYRDIWSLNDSECSIFIPAFSCLH